MEWCFIRENKKASCEAPLRSPLRAIHLRLNGLGELIASFVNECKRILGEGKCLAQANTKPSRPASSPFARRSDGSLFHAGNPRREGVLIETAQNGEGAPGPGP